MVESLHPTPVATLPFHSPHSAVVAFCEGILKHATAWETLGEDAEQASTMILEQVRERMRSVLLLTDVTRFPVPKNPQAVIFVAATDDGYIPKHSVLELQKAWQALKLGGLLAGMSHLSSSTTMRSERRLSILLTDWFGGNLEYELILQKGCPHHLFLHGFITRGLNEPSWSYSPDVMPFGEG